MRLLLTDRFRRAYRSLSPQDRKRVQKALLLMSEDLRYPGLRVRRVQGTGGIWEARASRSLRITFEVEGEDLILRNVGHHDDTLRKP
jgi:mRNA-degrading endonuclease RelE of RelBE toxin-antitoxin system